MFDNTVTLYNYHKATNSWYPTVLLGVDLGAAHGQKRSASVDTVNEDEVRLLVPAQPDKAAGGKSYLTPKEYAVCDAPEDCITFAPETDFLTESMPEDLSPVSDDDYDSGLYHYLNELRDGVYMVHSAEFYSLLPHWEIGGR